LIRIILQIYKPQTIGRDLKGNISVVLYLLGIGLAFTNRWLACAIYVIVAIMWLVPDKRIERNLIADNAHRNNEK